MPFLGQTTRLVVRAVKLDACPSCGVTGIHSIALRIRWLDVLWMPVVRLEQSYGLVCGSCGHAAHLGPSLVADALVAGKLDLARSRAVADRAVGAWSPPAGGWPVHRPEALAAMWKRRLIEILPQPGDRSTLRTPQHGLPSQSWWSSVSRLGLSWSQRPTRTCTETAQWRARLLARRLRRRRQSRPAPP